MYRCSFDPEGREIIQPERCVWHRRLSLLLAVEITATGGARNRSDLRTLIRRMSVENPLWGRHASGECSTRLAVAQSASQIHVKRAAAKPGGAPPHNHAQILLR